MRLVVLGGAGFIGSHLVDRLVSKCSDVLIIDNLSTGQQDNINPRACFRMASVCVPELRDVILTWGTPDAMILLAAQTSVARSCDRPLEDAQTNILGLINVIEVAVQLGVEYVLFSSSAAVYGEPDQLPTGETHSTDPRSPYAISKITGELYMRMLAPSGSFIPCIMRFSNVYGPRQRSDGEGGVVSIFADRFAHSRPVAIYGDGSQTRDFIYVADAVEAIAKAIELRASGVFNVSTNTSTSITDLYRIMSEVTAEHIPANFCPARPSDILHSRLDNSKAMAVLGWEPHIQLREGLKRTIMSWR